MAKRLRRRNSGDDGCQADVCQSRWLQSAVNQERRERGIEMPTVMVTNCPAIAFTLRVSAKSRLLNKEYRELRIWRLRRGLEFAACRRHLTGDQVAKLICHITWSCVLRRLALSLINAGYRFGRAFGPRSGRVWPAVAQEFKWIASFLPLLTCNLASPWSPWIHATDASGGARGGYGSQM